MKTKSEIMELVDELARLKHSQGMDDNSYFADCRRNAASTGKEAAEIRAAIEAALPDVPTVPEGWNPSAGPMTAHRALYFMERFKHEEKLLGPNEQAAVDFVIAMLLAAPEPAQAEQPRNEPTQEGD